MTKINPFDHPEDEEGDDVQKWIDSWPAWEREAAESIISSSMTNAQTVQEED